MLLNIERVTFCRQKVDLVNFYTVLTLLFGMNVVVFRRDWLLRLTINWPIGNDSECLVLVESL